MASVKGTFKEIMVSILDSSALTKRRFRYLFKEKVIAQTTAVCSDTGMRELTTSSTAILILWDSFSPSV